MLSPSAKNADVDDVTDGMKGALETRGETRGSAIGNPGGDGATRQTGQPPT